MWLKIRCGNSNRNHFTLVKKAQQRVVIIVQTELKAKFVSRNDSNTTAVSFKETGTRSAKQNLKEKKNSLSNINRNRENATTQQQ